MLELNSFFDILTFQLGAAGVTSPVEEWIAVQVLRFGIAGAGFVVAICAFVRAGRRIELPKKLLDDMSVLSAKLKTVELSYEQGIASFEERFNSAQKRMAAYASQDAKRETRELAEAAEEDSRRRRRREPDDGGNGQDEGPRAPPQSVPDALATLAQTKPDEARQIIRDARLNTNKGA